MATSPAHEVLIRNRDDARTLVQQTGYFKTRRLLEDSQRDLEKRLRDAIKGPGDKSFTAVQLKATVKQVREVLRTLTPAMQDVVVDTGVKAADSAASGTIRYLNSADKQYRGVGGTPLALNEARVFDAAAMGAKSSILRRLASSGEPVAGADDVPSEAKQGILDRYGMSTIEDFESTLQRGLITNKPWDAVRADLIDKSPFLQGKPASWAERIVRTESMGAYNRAGWEANREADEQLGDMVKILSATFDERTAADSYAVHGQIRRPDEAFETWYGLMQHPPARPNDREIVVPHRIAWPLPPYLRARDRGQVVARWMKEGRKTAPPPPVLMTTVDLDLFGR